MEKGIIIAGSGGQGILLLGRLIAYTSMLEGRNVTWFPSYGAEMRGGTANCTVLISDEVIGSPVVQNPDILIVFNCLSLERFLPRLKREGTVFYDSSLVTPEKCGRPGMLDGCLHSVAVEASAEAARLGSIRFANMVMFGAFLRVTGLSGLSVSEEALRAILPDRHHDLIPGNLRAIERGYGQG